VILSISLLDMSIPTKEKITTKFMVWLLKKRTKMTRNTTPTLRNCFKLSNIFHYDLLISERSAYVVFNDDNEVGLD